MRILYPSSMRSFWADRYPFFVGGSMGIVGETPHTHTLRIYYDTPSGKRVMVSNVCGYLRRSAAATTPGTWGIEVRVYTGAVEYNIAMFLSTDNTPGYFLPFNLPMEIHLMAGSTLRVYTSDDSVGGMCNYYLYWVGLRYDV